MNSFIPWVGGKSKLLWIINKMAPDHYSRFIDVFGGSGTVTMSRPIQPGCMEVYNDFNSNLTNLFCCVKNRPLALLAELGFLPLNTRDDFNVLYKFLSKGEITDDYLQEEMELTEILLKPPEAEAIRTLLLERAPRGDVRRAADFFKLVRYSFSGSSKSFGGKPCDIRRFFHLIWECSRRLANVIVENKDFEDVIRQYDRGDAWIYCDPPYFEAECYEVAFPKENHQRLHDTLLNSQGYREKHGGEYSSGNYVQKKTPELLENERLDGVFRIWMENPCPVRVQSETAQITLPATFEQLESARQLLGVDSLNMAKLTRVEALRPYLGEYLPLQGMDLRLEQLDELAENIRIMDQEDGALLKYLSVLEVEQPATLQEALRFSIELDDYERVPDDPEEYGKQVLERIGADEELISTLDGFTDFEALGNFYMQEDGVRRTDFGLVKRLSEPFASQEDGPAMAL